MAVRLGHDLTAVRLFSKVKLLVFIPIKLSQGMRPYRQTCTCLGHGLDESSSSFRPRCHCRIRPPFGFLLTKLGGLDIAGWTIEILAVLVAFVAFVSKSSLPDLVGAWQFLVDEAAFPVIFVEEC